MSSRIQTRIWQTILPFAVTGIWLHGQTMVVEVPATSNILLAGAPDGTVTRQGDSAPLNSPVLINLPLIANQSISVQASGTIDFPYYGQCSPDGRPDLGPWHTDRQFGVSSVYGPPVSLIGVFVAESLNQTLTAPELDFSGEGRNLPKLVPMLQQVFFIGNGRTSSGIPKQFIVPQKATRLFLGILHPSTRGLVGTYHIIADTGNIRGFFPQIVDGDAFKSVVTLLNNGTTVADYRLDFFHDDGSTLDLPLASGSAPVVGQVPVGGSVSIETTGSSSPGLQGWGRLSGSANLAGVVTYTQHFGWRSTDVEAAVPLTSCETRLLVPFEKSGPWGTGLAIANTEDSAQTITLRYRDDRGLDVGLATVNLAAHGHTAFLVGSEQAPAGSPMSGRGVVEITSGAPNTRFATMGLHVNPTSAFSSLPIVKPE